MHMHDNYNFILYYRIHNNWKSPPWFYKRFRKFRFYDFSKCKVQDHSRRCGDDNGKFSGLFSEINRLKECYAAETFSIENCILLRNYPPFTCRNPMKSFLSLSLSHSLRTGDLVTVRIVGPTIFGVRHGLETLQQLMTPDACEAGMLLIKSARIEDRPVYRHRGILLDTARNFISIPVIKRTIDGMGSTKFNVFHWHISDSHSFPMEIPSMPQFTIYGAYGANFTYSPNDVGDIIWYAKLRGIRVLIELDGPSHAGNGWNWGPEYGIGDLTVCVDKQPWRKYCIQPPCGIYRVYRLYKLYRPPIYPIYL